MMSACGWSGRPGIDQPRDLLVAGERTGDRAAFSVCRCDAHRQSLQTLEQDPGIERRQRRPGLPHDLMVVVQDQFFGAQDDAAEDAALAVDVLGRRIDDAIGAERERALVERRGEHVVDDQLGAGLMRDLGDRRDVDRPRASDWSAFP